MSFEEKDDDDIFGSPKFVSTRKPEFVMDIVKAITKWIIFFNIYHFKKKLVPIIYINIIKI